MMNWILDTMNFIKGLKPMDWIFLFGIFSTVATYFHNRNSSLKSDKILQTSEKNLQYQSGGNSFGEVLIYPINDEVANIFFHNMGDLPMYDVSIRIVDPHEFRKQSPTEHDIQEMKEIMALKELGTIHPRFKKPIGEIKRDFSGSRKFFFVDINSRAGGLHQETVFSREKIFRDGRRTYPDAWYYQTRVFKDSVLVHTSSNAPVNYKPNR